MTIHKMHTPEQIGKMLGVTVGTLANWRATLKGPPFINLNGGHGVVRYCDDKLAKWQQDQFDIKMGE